MSKIEKCVNDKYEPWGSVVECLYLVTGLLAAIMSMTAILTTQIPSLLIMVFAASFGLSLVAFTLYMFYVAIGTD
jgi:hypothetical protein